MTSDIITPQRYAKKTCVVLCGFAIITLVFMHIYAGLTMPEHSCIFFHTLLLAILWIPALPILVYNAYVGTSRLQRTTSMSNFSYYLAAILCAALSIISILAFGFLLAITRLLEGLLSCLGLFLFFGGSLILIPWFLFLCIISILELVIIKKYIQKARAS